MANTIDSSLMLSNYQSQNRKTGSDILGKDDFLKILMTQLQNQDPMNPMQDKDFIAQMATFSSLEQMTNMNKTMEKFVQANEQNQLISYNQFVGKDVTWHKLKESDDPTQPPTIEEGRGKIASIQFKNNSVVFILEDGTNLEPANISEVNEASNDSHILQASLMIGKKVTFLDANDKEVTSLIKSVSFRDGKTLFQLDDGEKSITASQIIGVE
ncbi:MULTISPECIES: flagellar hook assembly protein FlgD [Bacillaceae]|uniref:flagellar hook assembly protein FlgD n=1 Tax=Bacillaceae TaxID=186817 RepID=UPI001A8EA294|nr:flagellar hook assembly protein FlgD [Bacillus sp. NTK034]MBN8199594.1 flagellar hook assembly protein FlgD [Bacillus sp. NTK034]